ncbi:hypothetical protein SEA_UPYO_25 [Gordonia phage Upyo]|nr:hypothetical protein SEA_UPYO_25 [Gordonia phage Upyo]
MSTNLGKKRAQIGIIVLNDDDDWTLRLYPEDGGQWPVGTTARCRFYDSLGNTIDVNSTMPSPSYLTFTM